MKEELNIRQIIKDFVHFNIRNKSLIISFVLVGIVSVILFQNLKPSYYETKAICMSGISEYESRPASVCVLLCALSLLWHCASLASLCARQ